jgi:thiol-disulfide isomerase/thioredoxin
MRHLSILMTFFLLTACEPGQQATPKGAASERWLVINYWAEWCAPCREEIPELNRLAAELSDRVAVQGVNYDGLTGTAHDASAEVMGIEFPSSGDDPGPQLKLERPKVLPTTYLIAPGGQLAHTLIGPQTYEALLALVDEKPQVKP